MSISLVILLSFGIGAWFNVPTSMINGKLPVPEICMYILGYLIVLMPPLIYLRCSGFVWIVLCYVLVFLLVLVLLPLKQNLSLEYDKMSDVKPVFSLFISYVSAASFEEVLKCLVYVFPPCIVKDLRTIYDLLFLSVISGCSFATIENLLIARKGMKVALARFVWCTVTHTSDCLVGALILARIKLCEDMGKFKEFLYYTLVLIIPIILHGTYDYVLFLADDLQIYWIAYFSIGIGILSLLSATALFYRLRKQSLPIDEVTPSSCQIVKLA